MKQINKKTAQKGKLQVTLNQLLSSISEANAEAVCGGRATMGRDIIIHTSTGDDIISA